MVFGDTFYVYQVKPSYNLTLSRKPSSPPGLEMYKNSFCFLWIMKT